MADATFMNPDQGGHKAEVADTAREATGPRALRPADPAEIGMFHARLMEAIEGSPYYSDAFKAFETARLTPAFLRQLMALDPRNLLIATKGDTIIGLILCGPEFGTCWVYWMYVFPECRNACYPPAYIRDLVKVWNNDRFHKLANYVRPANKAMIAIVKRGGFRQIATLERHMFGDDFLFFEHALNKSLEGYDRGFAMPRLARLKYALLARIGR